MIFLIGDFTGMIGDPSGRSKARPTLTEDQLKENAATYAAQVHRVLDPELTRVEFNSTWMNRLGAADLVRLAGKRTLARMLERDDFRKRFGEGNPIGLHEFMYPIAQGYDSVALQAERNSAARPDLSKRCCCRRSGGAWTALADRADASAIGGNRRRSKNVQVAGQPYRDHGSARGDVRKADVGFR